MKKKWNGTWPASCDICGDPLDAFTVFYDARTKQGPWALLCPECFSELGVGLGTGFGQEYDSVTKEKIRG